MPKDAQIEDFMNDLSEDEVQTLIDLVGGLDRLATDQDGGAVYTPDEIDLIGRFSDFAIKLADEADEDPGTADDEGNDSQH